MARLTVCMALGRLIQLLEALPLLAKSHSICRMKLKVRFCKWPLVAHLTRLPARWLMPLLLAQKRFTHENESMKVDIYYSPQPRIIERETIDVLEGTLLGEALSARLAELVASQGLAYAVWARAVGLDYVLQADDRVELLRPLRVDPMTARRERFAKQGAKGKAGLFKTRRKGAKAGY